MREQAFEIPDAFLDLLPEGAPTTIEIFDAAPDLEGGRSSAAGVNPAIYITASIQGAITLFDTITLSGFIGFTASVDLTGNAYIQIVGAVSTKIDYVGALSGSLDLRFYTNYGGSQGPGIIGRVQLAIADGGAIPGVSLQGQFLLEVNSYLTDVMIQTFQTNIEADASYAGPQPNILATDPVTGLLVIGDVTLSAGLRILLEGELIIGSLITVSGSFEFVIAPTYVEIKASATMTLLDMGEFAIDAVFRVDEDGLAIYTNLSISAGFGEDLGLRFEASATLELSTATYTKELTTADGEIISIDPGFRLKLAGSVTFLGFASASGSITITAQPDRFTLEFDVMVHLGPIDVAAKGGAGIYGDGIALVLDVSLDVNLFEIIKIEASGTLQINTTGSARTLSGITVAGNSFLLDLNGSVTFLEVLKMEAGFIMEVGGDLGEGEWYVGFSAALDFFGIAEMSASGWFNSKGHFDLSLSGGITLGTSSFGLVASFNFNVALGERQVAGEPEGITEYFFHVGASGSAKLRAFGITFAGVSIGFDVTVAGSGRTPITVAAQAEVEFLFFSVSVSMSFNIGYIELPRIVYLAGNASGDTRLWSAAEGDGVLVLNTGSRNAERGIAEGAEDELYNVEHVGNDATGEIVRVTFSGREKIYRGVQKIVAFGGAGSDYIFVREGVTSDVELHGGAGNDVLFYDGSGSAWLYGDGGLDYLETGNASGKAYLYGGADQDYIVHNGSGQAVIHGGGGSDKIFGGPAGDIIYGGDNGANSGDAGDEIDGRGGSDTIHGGPGSDIIRWTFQSNADVTVNGGADAGVDAANDVKGDLLEVTVGPRNDNIQVSNLGSGRIKIAGLSGGSGDVGGVEDVRLFTLGGADTISLGYLQGADVQRLTLDVGQGARDTVTAYGSSAGDSITVSEAAGAIRIQGTGTEIIVAGSVRSQGDTLVIDALGGNDTVNASAVSVDRLALEVIGGTGNDTLIGSPFNDVMDSGLGSDRVTGGKGFDRFLDASGAGETDTLVETQDADISLFHDTLIVGTLQNSQGTNLFEVGKNPATELTDAGDRYAAGTIVEDLDGLFEKAEITGGAGNNTLVVNDRDGVVRVGNQYVSVINWRGEATLDNAGNSGLYPEHYLVSVPYGNAGIVHIVDSSADTNDRLVITTTDQADRLTLTSDGTSGTVTASVVAATQIDHRNVENVEIDTRAGDDRLAVRAVHTDTRIHTGFGDDIVNVGTNAGIGGAAVNTGGTLNDIDAPLTVAGQDDGGGQGLDLDILNLDDTADGLNNYGTLTQTTLTNGIAGSSGIYLMGAGGSITYTTFEAINLHLGDAVGGNVFTIENTHSGRSTTHLTTGDGADVINIERISGETTILTEDGSDTVRVGSTTGHVGQTAGILDAFDSALNNATETFFTHRLTLAADGGNVDTLKVYDRNDTQAENGILTPGEITGMGMTLGIGYEGFEVLKLWLSNANNNLYVAGTHTGVTVIDAGDEMQQGDDTNDVINIAAISGTTTVEAGDGNDIIRVNYDRDGKQTNLSGIDGELTLHGQRGSDKYDIGLAGMISSRINVFDQSRGDPGIDRLRVYGTDDTDFFLLRGNQDVGLGVVSAIEVDENREPVDGGVLERINYDGDINGAIEIYGRGGDDTFVLDDNLAPTVIFGDAGNDTFQVGQVFQSARDETNPDNGLAEEDFFETTQITRGFLSNGISRSTTLNGGIGNDTFTVYSNKAELFLFGDEDDDTFRVRAFVKVDPNDPKAPYTNINGGQGADFIEYTVNAPVRIDGGDGFDTLTVIGTEFGDDFAINDQGVYGAGLFVTYTGLEKIVVDALEGNDRFFIESTSEHVALEVVGGLGSDTFNVGGSYGQEVTVVSNNLEGHSGLIINTVSSDDPDYQNIFVQDISADVADNDEAGVVVILDSGPLRVFEDAAADASMIVGTYQVVLTRAPEESVQVTAAQVSLTEAAQAAGGKGIALNGSENGVTLLFTRANWFVPQTITVTAPDDRLAEGSANIIVQHNIIQGNSPKDGGAYDGLAALGVVVSVIDDDVAEVLIVPYNDDTSFPDEYDTIVGEGGGADPVAPTALQTDEYQVVLTKKPTGPVTVIISSIDAAGLNSDDQIRVITIDGVAVATAGNSLTFTGADWNQPQHIRVEAVNDADKEATHYSRITHAIDPATLNDFFGITLADVLNGLAASVNKDLALPYTATVDAGGTQLTITGPAFEEVIVTPYTTVNNDVAVALSGTPAAGENWVLMLNGKPFVYTVQDGDSLDDVAAGMSALVAADSLFFASVNGSVVSIGSPSLFIASFVASGASDGEAAISGETTAVTYDAGQSESAWTEANVAVTGDTGTDEEGAVWTLRLNGIAFEYVLPDDTTDLEDVAAGLADAVNQSDSGYAARYESARLEVTGTPIKGDVWTLTINGTVLDAYTVGSGEGLSDIANGLATILADAVTAGTLTGFTVVNTDNGDGIFEFSNTTTPFVVDVSASGDTLQSNGTITGRTGGASLLVSSENGGPFTVDVARAETASETGDPGTGGNVLAGSSTASATHWAKRVLTLSSGDVDKTVQGVTWTLSLDEPGSDAAEYAYVTGKNGEITVPDAIDVRIVDNDAPGVLILQSGNSTDVIEPTEVVLLGSGFMSQNSSVRFKLLGSPAEGETWWVRLTLEGENPTSYTVSHVVTGNPTLAGVASALAGKIDILPTFNSTASGDYLKVNNTLLMPFTLSLWSDNTSLSADVNYRAEASGNLLEVVNLTGTDFDNAGTTAASGSGALTPAVDNTVPKVTVTLAGAVTTGQQWTVTLKVGTDIRTYRHTVLDTDASTRGRYRCCPGRRHQRQRVDLHRRFRHLDHPRNRYSRFGVYRPGYRFGQVEHQRRRRDHPVDRDPAPDHPRHGG